jgi:hypothetical protein
MQRGKSGISRLPYARILVEGVVIVGSILLAFGIDAAWDSREEGVQSRALLEALSEDFEAARNRFDQWKTSHAYAFESAERLLTYAEDDRIREADRAQVDTLFSRLFYSMDTFNPPMGTVETILSSGRLDLFEDRVLVRELTRWTSALARYQVFQTAGSDHFFRTLYPFLAEAVDLQDLDIAVPWEVPWAHDPTAAVDLLANQEFRSLMYMHYVLLRNVGFQIPEVDQAIARISAMTDQALRQETVD